MSIKNANIKFVNMYDSQNDTEKQSACDIINMFIQNKLGALIYSMDIRKEVYINAGYLHDLKNEYVTAKENSEVVISNIHAFMKEYDKMIQSKDSYTAEHGRAVCKFSLEIGKKIGLTGPKLEILTIGAALHDIGKYEIDVNILTKNKRLTDPEFAQIKNNPVIGKQILDNVIFKDLTKRGNEEIELIVEQHHERFDGTGYPKKINGDIIHEYSMIVSIADAFHAMLGRSYQNPKSKLEIMNNIKSCSGTQFCPKYVAIFCDMLDSDIEVLGLMSDENGFLRYNCKQDIAELIQECKNYC